jgi:hypothetical protein
MPNAPEERGSLSIVDSGSLGESRGGCILMSLFTGARNNLRASYVKE